MHTTPKFDRVRVAAMAACAMLVATTIALVAAHEGGGIAACVNSHSGELRIVGSQNCPAGSYLLQWNERGEPGAAGPAGPAGPPGPAGSGGINVQYHWAGMYPDTSVSRAFCPLGMAVVGGGGITLNGAGLQQNYAISDETGVIAWGSTAIGWQVAASDWSDVQAFVICAGA
jgi:hypothetical protein